MTGRSGYQLAELNVGRLVASTDDPRVADFMAALDRVNGLGKRMSGFVWMMEESSVPSTGKTEAKTGGDPCHVANLTVWESVETLEASVFNTVHKQFFARRAKWFEVLEQMYFVMWWVPKGHCPGLDEVLARLSLLREHGPSVMAFGWVWLKEARSGQSRSAWTSAKLSGGGQHHPRLA